MQKGKVFFKLVDDSELEKILIKNKNLFSLKEVKQKPLPIIGIANCNK